VSSGSSTSSTAVDASVNYATEIASVAYDPSRVALEELVRTVEATGYSAALPNAESAREDPVGPLWRRLEVAAVLTVPLVLVAMIGALQFRGWEWAAFALATPIVFWAGWPFHQAAALNARHLAATMDTLISIGTLAAWAWSVVVLFARLDADGVLRGGRCDHDADPARPLPRGSGTSHFRRRGTRTAGARRKRGAGAARR